MTTSETKSVWDNIINKFDTDEAEARKQYRELLHVGATVGRFSAAQAKALAAVVETLSLDPKQIVLDGQTVEAYYAHVAERDRLSDFPAAAETMANQRHELNKEREEYSPAREARSKALDDETLPINGSASRHGWVNTKINEILSANRSLFDTPDPEIEARKAHLLHTIFAGNPTGQFKYEVRAVETLFGWNADELAAWIDRTTFVTMPGQNDDDVANLVAFARNVQAARAAGKAVRYLLTAEQAARVRVNETAASFEIYWQRDINFRKKEIHITASRDLLEKFDGLAFVSAPGQTQGEVDALAATIRRKIVLTIPAEYRKTDDRGVTEFDNDAPVERSSRPRELPSYCQ